MKERVLILGSMDEFVELVKVAKKRGYYTIVCDGYENGPAKKEADGFYNIDVRNVDEIVGVCEKERITGIMGSYSDVLFEQITHIANKAGLKWYVKPEKLKYYREKDKMKMVLSKLGIKTPKAKVIKKDFSKKDLEGVKFPIVAKPINGYGSKGIKIINSDKEIQHLFEQVVEFSTIKDKIIIEEYMNAREYNLMGFVADGEAFIIGIGDREKNPIQGNSVPLLNRIVYPSKNMDEVYEKAKDVLKKFIDYTGQKWGPLCMQFFFDTELYVCEIAGRFLAYEHEMISYVSGLNYEELLLDYLFDEEKVKKTLIKHSPYFGRNVAGLYMLVENGKRAKNQICIDEIGKWKGVFEARKYYNNGEKVDLYKKSYFARFFIEADSRKKIDELSKKIFKKFSIISTENKEIATRFYIEQKE